MGLEQGHMHRIVNCNCINENKLAISVASFIKIILYLDLYRVLSKQKIKQLKSYRTHASSYR